MPPSTIRTSQSTTSVSGRSIAPPKFRAGRRLKRRQVSAADQHRDTWIRRTAWLTRDRECLAKRRRGKARWTPTAWSGSWLKPLPVAVSSFIRSMGQMYMQAGRSSALHPSHLLGSTYVGKRRLLPASHRGPRREPGLGWRLYYGVLYPVGSAACKPGFPIWSRPNGTILRQLSPIHNGLVVGKGRSRLITRTGPVPVLGRSCRSGVSLRPNKPSRPALRRLVRNRLTTPNLVRRYDSD